MKQAHLYKKTYTSSSTLLNKTLSYPGGIKKPHQNPLPFFVLWFIFMALRGSNCMCPVRWGVKKHISLPSGLCSLHCDCLCKGYGACLHCLGHWKTAHALRRASWNGLGMLLSPSVLTPASARTAEQAPNPACGWQRCHQSSWQVNLSHSENPKKWSGLFFSPSLS